MLNEPLIAEIPYTDPLKILAYQQSEGILFLDSARPDATLGRYSFLAIDPFKTLIYKNGQGKLNGQWIKKDPFAILQEELSLWTLPRLENLPPFQGGIAGMLSYELGGYIEKLPQSPDPLQFPEMILGFYDLVIAWDHGLQKAWIFSSGLPEKTPINQKNRAQKRLAWLLTTLEKLPPLPTTNLFTEPAAYSITSNFTPKTYQEAVSRMMEYIRAGDIFEANLSQRFSAQLLPNCRPFMLYQRLRQLNPAPFAAYLQCGQYAIASASPERFLRLSQSTVEARPIKGTRARHQDKLQDDALAQELRTSEKDRAENIMIVDLMRNDLSRVCLPHSVTVTQLCEVESFATVHHLVSAVQGTLQADKSMIDLLKATFPGGSITGAPKIRAMEIITELEAAQRGPYCGSMGYLGFNGEMDLSIVIRTLVANGQQIAFQTGGAITVDSDPLAEYEETLVKARALIAALTKTE